MDLPDSPAPYIMHLAWATCFSSMDNRWRLSEVLWFIFTTIWITINTPESRKLIYKPRLLSLFKNKLAGEASVKLFSQFSSVQLLSRVWLFATPWTAAQQASLSITNSRSLHKLMSTEVEMPSSHLILCHPLLLPPSIFPSIRVFSSESVIRIRQPKYWSFSLSISPSNEYSGLISCTIDWLDLIAVQGTLKSLL